jgi:hypothetical protein
MLFWKYKILSYLKNCFHLSSISVVKWQLNAKIWIKFTFKWNKKDMALAQWPLNKIFCSRFMNELKWYSIEKSHSIKFFINFSCLNSVRLTILTWDNITLISSRQFLNKISLSFKHHLSTVNQVEILSQFHSINGTWKQFWITHLISKKFRYHSTLFCPIIATLFTYLAHACPTPSESVPWIPTRLYYWVNYV